MKSLMQVTKTKGFGLSKILMNKSADVDTKNNEDIMHVAAEEGYVEVIKYLRSHGVDINVRDKDGWTPMHYAAFAGRIDAIQCLTELGGVVGARDNCGDMPMHKASEAGHVEVIRYLKEFGADINHQDYEGATPLHTAASEGHVEVIEYLANQGSDVNIQDKDGWTPMHYAASEGYLDAVRCLRKLGADINKSGNGGLTILMCAADKGDEEIVKFLLDQHVDYFAKDSSGLTALHASIDFKEWSVVKQFIIAGAFNKGDVKDIENNKDDILKSCTLGVEVTVLANLIAVANQTGNIYLQSLETEFNSIVSSVINTIQKKDDTVKEICQEIKALKSKTQFSDLTVNNLRSLWNKVDQSFLQIFFSHLDDLKMPLTKKTKVTVDEEVTEDFYQGIDREELSNWAKEIGGQDDIHKDHEINKIGVSFEMI